MARQRLPSSGRPRRGGLENRLGLVRFEALRRSPPRSPLRSLQPPPEDRGLELMELSLEQDEYWESQQIIRPSRQDGYVTQLISPTFPAAGDTVTRPRLPIESNMSTARGSSYHHDPLDGESQILVRDAFSSRHGIDAWAMPSDFTIGTPAEDHKDPDPSQTAPLLGPDKTDLASSSTSMYEVIDDPATCARSCSGLATSAGLVGLVDPIQGDREAGEVQQDINSRTKTIDEELDARRSAFAEELILSPELGMRSGHAMFHMPLTAGPARVILGCVCPNAVDSIFDESTARNLGMTCIILPPGWEKVIYMRGWRPMLSEYYVVFKLLDKWGNEVPVAARLVKGILPCNLLAGRTLLKKLGFAKKGTYVPKEESGSDLWLDVAEPGDLAGPSEDSGQSVALNCAGYLCQCSDVAANMQGTGHYPLPPPAPNSSVAWPNAPTSPGQPTPAMRGIGNTTAGTQPLSTVNDVDTQGSGSGVLSSRVGSSGWSQVGANDGVLDFDGFDGMTFEERLDL